MIILGVDTETTGKESNSEIVELGLVLFDTEKQAIINQYGRILNVNEWNDDAERKHRIPKNYCDLVSKLDIDPWEIISGDSCELIVAHNAPFDHPYITNRWPNFKRKEWLCTWQDLGHDIFLDKRSGDPKTGRLAFLAVEYGIPVMGWHRALGDAEFCCRIAAKHDLNLALARKKLPRFKLKAKGSFDQTNVDWCKTRKWRWEDKLKYWHKDDLTKDDLFIEAALANDALSGWTIDAEKLPPKTY